MAAPSYVCSACGSENVQAAMWCVVNDYDRAVDAFGTFGHPDNSYCEDCDVAGRDPHQKLVPWEEPECQEYDKYEHEDKCR